MRLRPEQLAQSLEKRLVPVYLLSGDEPLQLGECADQVRTAAKAAGYSNREVFFAETGFNWNDLVYASDEIPLFSDSRLLDLRLPSASPGKDGARALTAYADNPPPDTLLLISTGKLSPSVQKSAWFRVVEKIGVVVQVWPLEGSGLLQWLQRRMAGRGLRTDEAGLKLLASRVEGNLLAAAQEIDKLQVLKGAGFISCETLQEVVADSSRYDVFGLVDAALQARPRRLERILAGVRQEGVASAIVLWALTREIRLLAGLKADQARGLAGDGLFKRHQVWDKRRPLLGRAMERLSAADLERLLCLGARADRIIKGLEMGDDWDALLALAMGLAGIQLPGTAPGRGAAVGAVFFG